MASKKFYIDRMEIAKHQSGVKDIVLPSDARLVTGIMIKAYNRSFYELTGGFEESYFPIVDPKADFLNEPKNGIINVLQNILEFNTDFPLISFCFSKYAGLNVIVKAALFFIESRKDNPVFLTNHIEDDGQFSDFFDNNKQGIVDLLFGLAATHSGLNLPTRIRDVLYDLDGFMSSFEGYPYELGGFDTGYIDSIVYAAYTNQPDYYGSENGSIQVYLPESEMYSYQIEYDESVLRANDKAETTYQITEAIKFWLKRFPEFLLRNVTTYYNVQTFLTTKIDTFIESIVSEKDVLYLGGNAKKIEELFLNAPTYYSDKIINQIASINGQSGSYIPLTVTYQQFIVGNISILTEAGYEIDIRDYPVQLNDNKVKIRTDLIEVRLPVFVGSQARAVFKNNLSFDDGFTIDIYFQYTK